MKEYVKPELIEISFTTENIAAVDGEEDVKSWGGNNEVA